MPARPACSDLGQMVDKLVRRHRKAAKADTAGIIDRVADRPGAAADTEFAHTFRLKRAGGGAICNAIYNACGVRLRSFPMTPDKLIDHLPEI